MSSYPVVVPKIYDVMMHDDVMMQRCKSPKVRKKAKPSRGRFVFSMIPARDRGMTILEPFCEQLLTSVLLCSLDYNHLQSRASVLFVLLLLLFVFTAFACRVGADHTGIIEKAEALSTLCESTPLSTAVLSRDQSFKIVYKKCSRLIMVEAPAEVPWR